MTMVDAKLTMADGTIYDVRCLLAPSGGTVKVRDVMVGRFSGQHRF